MYLTDGSILLLYYIPILILDGLKRRLIRGENGVHFDRPSLSYDQKDFVPLEVKSGSLVVIHGNLVHQRSFLLCCVLHISTWYMFSFLNFCALTVSKTSLRNLDMP